ncbi:Uncharacterized protein Fot_30695 [Forsythia ovata]|uniref:Uncharacterized protein n=1 Tax=Forsythia ovata TaxID=205694 RepID=A0ABD1T3D0_9LAMI
MPENLIAFEEDKSHFHSAIITWPPDVNFLKDACDMSVSRLPRVLIRSMDALKNGQSKRMSKSNLQNHKMHRDESFDFQSSLAIEESKIMLEVEVPTTSTLFSDQQLTALEKHEARSNKEDTPSTASKPDQQVKDIKSIVYLNARKNIVS